MHTTRRHFLQSVAATASLGIADLELLPSFAALGADDPPVKVRFGPEVEPVVRLIEDTPQDQCVAAIIDQLRRGLPYRLFLAGIFYAGVRVQKSNHEVYRIHSIHQVSLDARPEERLLPLLWAVITYKQHQIDFPRPALLELRGTLPAAEQAAAEFAVAMDRREVDRAERAAVSMARAQGARQTMEQLWWYGCRMGNLGGHAAIVVANCFRALETIGWHEAESVVRFVVQDLHALGADRPDKYFQPNVERIDRQLAQLPPTWAAGAEHAAATGELLALLRAGKPESACELACQQLLAGVGSQTIWDAVHLATAEMMVRHQSGWGLASRPLHANTSTNALHYAFRTCINPRTRALALLQGVAWAGNKIGAELAAGDLRDMKIMELGTASAGNDPAKTLSEIYAQLPERHYHWDAQTKKAVLSYGQRSDADEACRKTFALVQEHPQAVPQFMQLARSYLCRKSNSDAHEYKYLAAILEDAGWVSPRWQPHLLAASVHYFHGEQGPDNLPVQQAREALRTVG